jgi:photosystem II stability/assembly factor-like uncharacterized protein
LCVFLVVVAVSASSCSLAVHRTTTPPTHVLGEPRGTPLALGKPAPSDTGQLDAVSCASAKRCWAVGVAGPDPASPTGATVIVATRDGGASWQAQHSAGASPPQLSGVSCPSTTECMAVGSTGASLPGSGVVLTTSDGGATWSPATVPANALAVTSVTCDGPACVAIVSDGTSTWSALTTDFGQTWQRAGTLPTAFVPGNDLLCTPIGTCLVAGYVPTGSGHGTGAIALSTDGGHTWAPATVPSGSGVLQSVACTSTASCVAAGTTSSTVSDVVPAKGQLLRSTDGGHTWTTVSAALPVDDVYAVACPSAQQCAMVGTKWTGFPAVATGALAQSLNGGQTFRASSGAYVPLTLTALSCPTVAGCVAVGGDTVARLTLVPAGHPPATSPGRPHRLPQS